jgi:DNA polymerase III subunit epsilon
MGRRATPQINRPLFCGYGLILLSFLAMFFGVRNYFTEAVMGLLDALFGRKASKPARPLAKPDLSMLPERFIVFDFETTGLSPQKHEIIEIGAIRVNRDSDLHDTFSTLVIPEGRITAKITQITGINRDMVKVDGLPLVDAIEQFREFVGTYPMVAFNCPFDRDFLHAACGRVKGEPFTNDFHCALQLARRAWPGRNSYKLSAICADAGIRAQSGAAHRALPDCELAMRTFIAAAQNVRGIGKPLLAR